MIISHDFTDLLSVFSLSGTMEVWIRKITRPVENLFTQNIKEGTNGSEGTKIVCTGSHAHVHVLPNYSLSKFPPLSPWVIQYTVYVDCIFIFDTTWPLLLLMAHKN